MTVNSVGKHVRTIKNYSTNWIMKRLLLISMLFITACNHSTTESKIKEAIEKIDREQYDDIEYLKIDSVHYSLGSLTLLYLKLAELKRNYLGEQRSRREDAKKYRFYSSLVKLSHDMHYTEAKADLLSKLSEHPDTSIKVYNVDYYINFKSPKYSNEGHEKAYLYASDLKPIKINLDSIYIANNVNPEMYDSTEEINALRMNDSLELQANKLEREVELLRAGGSSLDVILNVELRILKIRKQAAGDRLKYYWLY
jgi:hypothetical protein